MANQAKSVKNSSKHFTKAEIEARESAEAQVVTNQTTPKASPMLTPEERKIFNQLKKHNDNYTESDSDSLNLLAQYLHMWAKLKRAYNALEIDDERSSIYERRMIAIDKQIAQHMKDLCIPLSQRLKLANDMAKVMIEEKKLEQMEKDAQPKEVNPLLQLLAELDE